MLFLHSLSNTALPGRSCHPGCRRTSSVSLKCIVFIITSLPFSFLPLCTLLWNALNYVCTDMYYAFNGEAFMYWALHLAVHMLKNLLWTCWLNWMFPNKKNTDKLTHVFGVFFFCLRMNLLFLVVGSLIRGRIKLLGYCLLNLKKTIKYILLISLINYLVWSQSIHTTKVPIS